MSVIRRVACAISGGVDSAVSAYLLRKRGFNVVGVYMINWDNVEEGTSACPRTEDEYDATETCKALGIDFHTVNFVKEYWNYIFSYLLENYTKGRTVVPDILCNNIVKFDLLHKYAFEKLGVDAVATGHFVRTTYGDYLEKRDEGCAVNLLTGIDPLKDQSYFLCGLTQSQLSRSMFPVGSLTKTEVRSIARNAGLAVADKREYLEKRVGVIRHIETGEELGKHEGIHHFNVGRRIRFSENSHQSSLRFFVTSLDFETNTVWACEGNLHPSLYVTEFTIKEPSWIVDSPFYDSNTTSVNFRCQRTHPAFQCTLIRGYNGTIRVLPRNPVRAAAPGQVCVIYDGVKCLGGGEIIDVIHTLYR